MKPMIKGDESQTVSISADFGNGPRFIGDIYNVATAVQTALCIFFFNAEGHMIAGINPDRATHNFKGDIQPE